MEEHSIEEPGAVHPTDVPVDHLVYESNPKHTDPWQSGRKGSICEADVRPHAQALLLESEVDGDKRYAVFDGKAYCDVSDTTPLGLPQWLAGFCATPKKVAILSSAKTGEPSGQARWGTSVGRVYCAQQHRPATWHGYPVGWVEVPYRLQKLWKEAGKVTKR